MPKKQPHSTTVQEQNQVQETAPQQQQQLPPMELDVRIRPVGKGNLMAYASMNINKAFAVDGIKVISGERGLFVSMPSYKDGNGQYRDVCFPVNKEFREQINNAVIGQYQQTLAQMQSVEQQREAPTPVQEPSGPVMGM